MKVLVTGSNGFIGRELCSELRKRNAEVVEFDKSKGKDILNIDQLEQNCKGCDAIIHLAALLDEKAPMKELRKINVEGTKNALEVAARQKVKKFILQSTTGVYGDFQGQASEETQKKPSTNYEISKSEAEEIALEFQEMIPITIARSALVLGPNDYWKQIIDVIKKDFPIIGSGKNKWQIIYYKDLVNALIFLLYSKDSEFETFNIAEDPEKAKSLNELVELIKKEIGIEKKTRHVPVILGFLMLSLKSIVDKLKRKKSVISPEYIKRLLKNRNYSIAKIQKIGWKPKYSTEEAVKETIKALQGD
ncbi:MAG: NAD(P)-dependent oxidoreductase [Candidatus Diapherotrites archaeon]|nr:NAD(P)-dependent oxidoreductase [Candidatus Diapherotrites archaeon]